MVDTTTENCTKKRVPDWLNSSLWSSTPDSSPHSEDADDVSGQTIKSATITSNSSLPKESPESPPQIEPPVIIQSIEPAPKLDTRDPLCTSPSGYGNYDSHVVEENEVIITSSGVVSDCDATSPKDVMQTPRVASGLEDISRRAQILQELSRKVVNLVELRRLSSQGLPDGDGIRATVWKLLLAYLPCDRLLWSSELDKKRSQYMNFKEEMLMNPTEITRRLEKSSIEDDILNSEDGDSLSRSEVTHGEHPLSLGKTSVWNQFFQDTEIMEQIDRDVKRTHPDFNFFSGDSSFARSNQDALKNILIIFAKLNPGIRYVQGMNEILAPVYYVFRSDPNEENAACAEADSFFCFVEILSGFRDNFCQQLDNSVVGIRATISRLSQLLKDHDEELWRHLEITTKVNPQFYAFRWITLLLAQEFNFPDSLFIWDTLLSDPDGPQETLLRVCCAMLIIIRKRLLAGDFTANLKLLQNYPPTNISHLLYVANKLRPQLGS